MKLFITIFCSLVFTYLGISQDLISPVLSGSVYDLERNFTIIDAEILLYCDDGSFISTRTDSTGQYKIDWKGIDNSQNYLMEVKAHDYVSESRVLDRKNPYVQQNFYLKPKMICIDKWFPEHFKFEMNSSVFHPDDSLAFVLRFSNPEIKEMLQTYSYNIVVRRSTEESDQTALDRGNALRNLFIKMGIDPERISIENKSTSDFFYCLYCEGCVYEYQNGQGLDITQELIDSTTDPIKRQEYEAMRRIAEVEMRKGE